MSAPPDPALALRLMQEFQENDNFWENVGEELKNTLLRVIEAILAGRSHSNYSDFYEINILLRLPCGPLVQPFLQERMWTSDEIKVLRVKEKLKS